MTDDELWAMWATPGIATRQMVRMLYEKGREDALRESAAPEREKGSGEAGNMSLSELVRRVKRGEKWQLADAAPSLKGSGESEPEAAARAVLTDEQGAAIYRQAIDLMAPCLVGDAWIAELVREILAAAQAVEPFALVRSIIHKCPAIKMPQSFWQKLGMTAQIVPIHCDDATAALIVDRLNAAPQSAGSAIPAAIPRQLLGLIVDDVFGGACEDTSPIEEIYSLIAAHINGQSAGSGDSELEVAARAVSRTSEFRAECDRLDDENRRLRAKIADIEGDENYVHVADLERQEYLVDQAIRLCVDLRSFVPMDEAFSGRVTAFINDATQGIAAPRAASTEAQSGERP